MSCPTLAIPWTVACQAPLSMGFSKREHWIGLPFPSSGDIPNPGIETRSPALQVDSLPTELWGKSFLSLNLLLNILIFLISLSVIMRGSINSCCCSVAQSCQTPCSPSDCNTPGFPVLHCPLEFAQTHVCWFSDALQPPHPLSSPSPLAPNLSQHQGLFQWVSSLHQVAKVLELQLRHQSFQWIFRVDFLYNWLAWSSYSTSFK